MKAGAHLTESGLTKIRKIKSQMNRARVFLIDNNSKKND